MRKLFRAFATIFLFTIMLSMTTFAASIVDSGTFGENVKWSFYDNGELCITGKGEIPDITEYKDGYEYNGTEKASLMAIAPNPIPYTPWFDYRNSIKAITIGDGITAVGSEVFMKSGTLEVVNFGSDIERIGDNAFSHCGMLKSAELPDSLKEIGDRAFLHCSSLSSVSFSKEVGNTVIGSKVFSNCESLASVDLGNSVAEIGNYAFENCASIKSLHIPESVKYIGIFPFIGCCDIERMTVDEKNEYYCSDEQGVLYDKSMTQLLLYPYGCGRSEYIMPNTVQQLHASAFFGCDSLEKVQFSEKLTYIGDECFRNCSGLREITLPDGVEYIGHVAFAECFGLEKLYLGKSLTEIGNNAFSNCKSLTAVVIPDTTESIGVNAFMNCTSLTEVYIGNGVTAVYNRCFQNCPIKTLGLGKGVKFILDNAINRINLKTVYYSGSMEEWNNIQIIDWTYDNQVATATEWFGEPVFIDTNSDGGFDAKDVVTDITNAAADNNTVDMQRLNMIMKLIKSLMEHIGF